MFTRASIGARRTTFPGWRQVAAAFALLTPLVFGQPIAAETGTPHDEPDLATNAAIDYWKAVALLQTPRSAQDLETLDFIRSQLSPFPPRVFLVRPDIGRWLLEEKPALIAMARGTQKPHCRFSIRAATDIAPDLEHLAAMQLLAARALQAAKAYEYADNRTGAAAIYVSLLRLAQHLDQDRNLQSGVIAAEIVQDVLDEVTGFVSREPSSQAIATLTQHFAEAPSRLLSPDAYLRADADHYAAWLLEDVNLAEERLESLYGNAVRKPAVERIMTLEPDRKAERLTGWVENYRQRVSELADAVAKPYRLGLYLIRDMDMERVNMKENSSSEDVNPLVPLLVPAMEKVYERFLMAEAHYVLTDILSAACLYHADLNEWPASLSALSRFVGRTFRRDPFTGKDIEYGLKGGMPIVNIRAPKWLAKDPQVRFRVTVATRREQDEERVEAYAREVVKKERREKIQERTQGVAR